MIGKIWSFNLDLITNKPKLTIVFENDSEARLLFDKYKDKERLNIEIKQYRKKRSLDANSYLWVLCDKIAKQIYSTKEEVYRQAIRQVGVFTFAMVQDKDTEQFIEMWEHNGLGWVAEPMDICKIDNCTKIIMYHGSSTYDSKQMSELLDYIVEEAKELGIETMTPNELENLKSMWR